MKGSDPRTRVSFAGHTVSRSPRVACFVHARGMTHRPALDDGRIIGRPARRSLVVAFAGILVLVAGCRADAGVGGAVPPTVSAAAPAIGTAAEALSQLPVSGSAPMAGYSRGQFGQAWTDDNSNFSGRDGCDERNNALQRGLTDLVIKPGTHGCVVLSGTLVDPYTGRVIPFVRGPDSADVQIDHLVSEAGAWRTGAQLLTVDQRRDFATDPLDLLAVDGQVNQAKGDGDAAEWLPEHHRCLFVARQIAVKTKWHLWLTAPEKDAMAEVLIGCPGQQLPGEQSPDVTGPIPAD